MGLFFVGTISPGGEYSYIAGVFWPGEGVVELFCKKYLAKKALGIFLIIAGIIAIVCFVPSWIWIVLGCIGLICLGVSYLLC